MEDKRLKIINKEEQEYDSELFEIVEVDGNYFLMKTQYDVKINNVAVNSRYTIISEGDAIEIEKGNHHEIYYVVGEEYNLSDLNNTKILSPFMVPPYQLYPQVTDTLAVLCAHNNYKEWLFDNCNLLWAYKWIWDFVYWCDFVYRDNSVKRQQYNNIDTTEINNSKMLDEDSIIKFLEQELKGKYLFVSLDMWPVSGWWENEEEKKHLNHPVLVYGYDKVNNLVYCADFLKQKYTKYTLTYAQFAGAFIGGYYGGNQIAQLWKYNDTSIEYGFETFKKNVLDFTLSKNTVKNNFLSLGAYCNALYGFEAIEKIIKQTVNSIEAKFFWDWRPIHLIKIINQVLKDMVIYFEQKGELKQEQIEPVVKKIDSIVLDISKLELLLIKVRIKRSNKKCETIKNKLNQMLQDMKDIYCLLSESLIDDLSFYQKNKIENKWDTLKQNTECDSEEDLKKHEKYLSYLCQIFDRHEEIKDNYVDEVLAEYKIIKNVSDYYENVFPYEIEEDGYACLGEIIEKRTLSSISEKVYYYDNQKRVVAIEYLTSYGSQKYLLYEYTDNQVLRKKFAKQDGKLIIENVKLKITDNNNIYIYSYKKEKQERKIDIYYIENNKCNKSLRYKCSNLSLPLEKWVNSLWAENKKYVYNKNGELLQIYLYNYENKRKMIYSNYNTGFGWLTNLNMQLQEEKIVTWFSHLLINKAKIANEKLKVQFQSDGHQVLFVCDDKNDEKDGFSFLEEYDIEGEGLNRFNILFAREIYYYLEKNQIEIEYYFDNKLIEVADGVFYDKCVIES